MDVTRLANTAVSSLVAYSCSSRHSVRLHSQSSTNLTELPSSRAAARLAHPAISLLATYPCIFASCSDHPSKKFCSKGNARVTGYKIPSFKLSIPSSKTTGLQLVSRLLSSTLASTLSFLIPVPISLAGTYDNLFTELALSSPTRAIEINESSYGDAIKDNPLAILVGLVALSLPFILPKVLKLGDPETFGSVTAREAYEELSEKEGKAQLLDIRAKEEVGKDGAPPGFPDLGAFGKKVVQLPYTEEDDYAEKVLAKFKDAENSTLFIMDRLDGKSLAVAKLLTRKGCRGAYAIQGGGDGYGGWQMSDLPWQSSINSNSNSLDDVNALKAIKFLPSCNVHHPIVKEAVGQPFLKRPKLNLEIVNALVSCSMSCKELRKITVGLPLGELVV